MIEVAGGKLIEAATTKSLDEVYKNRAQIMPALRSALKRMTDGKTTVALFGPGGVGKTTTQTLLADGRHAAAKPTDHLPTSNAKMRRRQDNWTIGVWDTPGQEEFRKVAWDEAFANVANSRKCVLINLVAYGYNSTGALPFSALRKQSPKKTDAEVIRNYLRLERQKERKVIDELAVRVAALPAKCRIHLLTIVNKQDLWWQNRDAVYDYYTTGPYGKAVAKLANQRPKELFVRSLKAVSLCQINLVTCDGVTIAEVAKGFDSVQREFYLNHLLSELSQVAS